jgi:ribose transport system substrate-binding protein
VGTSLAVAVLVSGCGTGNRPSGGRAGDQAGDHASRPPAAGPSLGTGDVLAESADLVAQQYRGTYKPPDSTPRPAARGKKLFIISGGQASATSAIPTEGAVEAGRALGWQVQVLDMRFDPANAAKLVSQAITSGADAIVANFDCVLAATELAEAKAKGIQTVPLYGFDCDDPGLGSRAGQPLYTTFVNYGLTRVDAPKYHAGFGALTASVIINQSHGSAKVVSFSDSTSTAMRYITLGFEQQMKRCPGCQIVENVEFTPAELGPPLIEKAVAALRRHPDATAVRTPYSAATLLSIAPALVRTGRNEKLMVIGGEGFAQDLDLIRTDKGLTTTFLIDSEWTGWSAVDALNSRFAGQEARPAGFGTMLVDKEHNLPPSGPAQHNIDFKSIYRRAWGVG